MTVMWSEFARCHECGVGAGFVCCDENDNPRATICKGRQCRRKVDPRKDAAALRALNTQLREELADRKEQARRLAAQLAEARAKLDRIAAMVAT